MAESSGAERTKSAFAVRREFHTFRGDPDGGLVRVAGERDAHTVIAGATWRTPPFPAPAPEPS